MRVTRDDHDHYVLAGFNWVTAVGFATLGPVAGINLTLDQRASSNSYIAAGVILVSLVGANQIATRTVLGFDKSERKLLWKSLALTRRRSSVILFADITLAGVQTLRDHNAPLYRLVVHATRGEVLPTCSYVSGDKDRLDAVADQTISSFVRGLWFDAFSPGQ